MDIQDNNINNEPITRKGDFSEMADETKRINTITISLCVCGIAIVKLNSTEYILSRNSVLILLPQDSLLLKESSADFQILAISFPKNLLREAMFGINTTIYKDLFKYRYSDGNEGKAHKIIRPIYDILSFYDSEKNCACKQEQTILLLHVLMLGVQDKINTKKNKVSAYSITELHFKKFIRTLNQYHKESREVSFYADKLNITAKYLNSICKKTNGISAKKLIDDYTVRQLKFTLKRTDSSIQEIADLFNFPNQSFMGKYFKKIVGVSPKEFRDRH